MSRLVPRMGRHQFDRPVEVGVGGRTVGPSRQSEQTMSAHQIATGAVELTCSPHSSMVEELVRMAGGARRPLEEARDVFFARLHRRSDDFDATRALRLVSRALDAVGQSDASHLAHRGPARASRAERRLPAPSPERSSRPRPTPPLAVRPAPAAPPAVLHSVPAAPPAALDPVPAAPPAVLHSVPAARALRPARAAAWTSFRAVLLRDLAVLDKNLGPFLARTTTQPLLFLFIMTYVWPRMRGSAGGSAEFTTMLVAGIVTLSVFLQSIQSVAPPLVQELGVTGEIEDRVLAPMSVRMVAVEKIVAGALQGVFAGCIVFPIAAVVPLTPIAFDVSWPVLLTIVPLACLNGAAAGLTLGTLFDPRTMNLMYSVILLPVAFLGGVFYSWTQLDPIPWLKYSVLANPLIYMSEGMRAALMSSQEHMPLPTVYGVLVTSAVLLTVAAVRGLKRRVLL